ncbi:gamma-glutamylcyclotransferase family protein [Fictibacillus phosphorivorans]|uniref:gamma-glutamylcyclotransferase family protein n=1 Tax=Fictibacillus phosphorivorans TaxID=1221500 RepID=UPI00203B0DB5|nr:gamma-glutamylcyclotransferase [Fictibacillus phosphorivorans]MCM3776674.1 gamma-glutamylcyclotransferase [Fictibacillus phosphorivorans]
MKSHLVFVYGTLRKGEKYAYYLNKAECLGENCTIEGTLYDTGGGYPALLCENSKIPVKGELYKITADQLKELDKLEEYEEDGTHNLYERITVKVTTEDGEKDAIVYVMTSKRDHFKRIKSNDWINLQK